MSKRIRIHIFPDGRVQAEVQGVKGKTCTDYIAILEELLVAETYESSYTPEYYGREVIQISQDERQTLRDSEEGTSA